MAAIVFEYLLYARHYIMCNKVTEVGRGGGMITLCLAQSKHSITVSYYFILQMKKLRLRELKVAHQVSSNAGIDSPAYVLSTVHSFSIY